ncbi:hypothetical protein BDN72DRAFT_856336 [Pluteus cervinus]|uniref:Uncharacterized protein n=1 Tax=Pluteus cervinus TaxID=181527 RepID=A0ACD3B011_9AGAR|nr:hypothetical protein BDN72DRAFT_856336 [Pluteus cervinus]
MEYKRTVSCNRYLMDPTIPSAFQGNLEFITNPSSNEWPPALRCPEDELSMGFMFGTLPYHQFNGIQSVIITIARLPRNQYLYDAHLNHLAKVSDLAAAAAKGKLTVNPEGSLATASGPGYGQEEKPSKSRLRILKEKLAARKDPSARASGCGTSGSNGESLVRQNPNQQREVVDRVQQNSWSPLKRSLFLMAARAILDKFGKDYILHHFAGLIGPHSGNCDELERQLWLENPTVERVEESRKETENWLLSVHHWEYYLASMLKETMENQRREEEQQNTEEGESEGDQDKDRSGDELNWEKREFRFTEPCKLHQKRLLVQHFIQCQWAESNDNNEPPKPLEIEWKFSHDPEDEEDEEDEEFVSLEKSVDGINAPESRLEGLVRETTCPEEYLSAL